MSEFGVVLFVVVAVSIWLGFRLYRFLRGLASDTSTKRPACAVGCPSCSEDAPGCAAPASILAELESVKAK